MESVRSMLFGGQLPQRFWAEALATAVYLRNRSPTKANEVITPHEAWLGVKPKVNHLRIFGCSAYAHISKEERRKLDPKAKQCILLGYGTATKGYRLYDINNKRVFYSRDVVFDEGKSGFEKEETDETDNSVAIELSDDVLVPTETEVIEQNNEPDEEELEEAPALRKSTRVRRPPDYYGTYVNTVKADFSPEPTTFNEAASSPDNKHWLEAMEKEMSSLKSNEVYDLVELPKDRKVVGSKWVYKRKMKADGSIERYKARLVAQGFTQRAGQDYDETFSPVVRSESLRTTIAIAVQNDMMLHHMDVTSAFLNGDLEEVFMKQPEGFEVKGKEQMVYKLKKSLYGLKQAPRCWNMTLDQQLKKLGFIQSSSDPCLYISNSEGELFIIAVYVDDMLLVTRNQKKMKEVKHKLSTQFEIKDLGDLHYILGVSVIQNSSEKSVWIGQPAYTSTVIEKFGLTNAKPVDTPTAAGSKLTTATDDDELIDTSLYQSAVGSLQYLSTMTRPDISFAVSNVAKFCSKPSKEHWVAVKRIMRYLKGTLNYGLLYKKSKLNTCVGYSDADWAGDVNDRKSTSGYIFQVGGTAVSWKSQKQSCTALSTAEAEYVALSQAAQEAIWLRQLNSDLLSDSCEPTVLYEDNQAAICLSKNPQSHGKSKHIDIRYHFIREQVSKGTIEVKYCPTNDMIADILTKGLGKEKFHKLRRLAGVTQSD